MLRGRYGGVLTPRIGYVTDLETIYTVCMGMGTRKTPFAGVFRGVEGPKIWKAESEARA